MLMQDSWYGKDVDWWAVGCFLYEELYITPGTVKVHLMHIFEKAGVKDRFELAVQGRRLLGTDEPVILEVNPLSVEITASGD